MNQKLYILKGGIVQPRLEVNNLSFSECPSPSSIPPRTPSPSQMGSMEAQSQVKGANIQRPTIWEWERMNIYIGKGS